MTNPPPPAPNPSHPQPSPISAMASPATTTASKKETALLQRQENRPPNTATAEYGLAKAWPPPIAISSRLSY